MNLGIRGLDNLPTKSWRNYRSWRMRRWKRLYSLARSSWGWHVALRSAFTNRKRSEVRAVRPNVGRFLRKMPVLAICQCKSRESLHTFHFPHHSARIFNPPNHFWIHLEKFRDDRKRFEKQTVSELRGFGYRHRTYPMVANSGNRKGRANRGSPKSVRDSVLFRVFIWVEVQHVHYHVARAGEFGIDLNGVYAKSNLVGLFSNWSSSGE